MTVNDFTARLIVVDNDLAESARTIVESFTNNFPIPISYVVEAERGIASARNRLVQTARSFGADFVSFVDDDQLVEPNWLQELVKAAIEWDVEAVVGSWQPKFETGTPKWVYRSHFWDRPDRKTGHPAENHGTGNVLVKLRPMLEIPGPFDTSLNLDGGTDTHFFDEFRRRGNRAFWCETSLVHERIPASRATATWMVRRMYRVGVVNATRLKKTAHSSLAVVSFAADAVAKMAKHLVLLPFSLHDGRASLVARACRVAEAMGRLGGLVGLRYKEYTTIHGE